MLMGCIHCKCINLSREHRFHPTKSLKKFITFKRKGGAKADKGVVPKPEENVAASQTIEWEKRDTGGVHLPTRVAEKKATGGAGVGVEVVGVSDEYNHNFRIPDTPSGFSGEHAAAGWPSWLTAVAGEAIKGWLPRRSSSFEKLAKIGQGTYSNVYKARDLETGKIVALKKVRFVNMDPDSVRFMAREIHILRQLDHPNVIKLEGIVTSQMSQSLYLVFEYMEHDLAGILARRGPKLTEPQVKCYMQQLLQGLAHCHSRGILHRDIKGSNLLVSDNGILKIADFGLSTPFVHGQKQPLTSRVVTLWYRPPELLLGATKYGVSVDLWSAGCILAELFVGKPIMPGRTEVEQLHKIFKLCGSPSEEYWKKSKLPHATVFKPQYQYKRCIAETFRDFPSSAITLLDSLLAIEPKSRGTTASALGSEFFKSKPLACDASSLPKYPPSKEYDVKLQDERLRKQKEDVNKGRSESVRQGMKDAKGIPLSDANMEQKPKTQVTSESATKKYNQLDASGSNKAILNKSASTRKKDDRILSKESAIGYGTRHKRIHYSGPLMPPGGDVEDMLKEHERQIQQAVRKARHEKVDI
ncbi:putative serine/threonine-protein kinase At1g09600 [Curcuma longa]|uniref:putative serine/threonine-protein kinase At1g09600 n=1 Tax=Curcuma longa TaxID=136217 RepID=UPI003D9ECBDA